MRLVLDPAEEPAHGQWLRQMPGSYEWWYFDALSDDAEWALSCIWFLGNPFSPYYRQSALGQSADPFENNAIFFALYCQGKLYAYHFTRFPKSELAATERLPLCLRFGPNRLSLSGSNCWRLDLDDKNANGRHLAASLTFTSPSLIAGDLEETPLDDQHSWLPIAPYCRVSGTITLREPHNPGSEEIHFTGTGYHDHNWGRLPFDAAIRDWYWARAALSDARSIILYHVQPHQGPPVSHLLFFESGRLTHHDAEAKVKLSRFIWNGFGTRYSSRLIVSSGNFGVRFRFGTRLDSAPFYIRALCSAEVTQDGLTESGEGIGEYLRPRPMSWPLVASAMKARIVAR